MLAKSGAKLNLDFVVAMTTLIALQASNVSGVTYFEESSLPNKTGEA